MIKILDNKKYSFVKSKRVNSIIIIFKFFNKFLYIFLFFFLIIMKKYSKLNVLLCTIAKEENRYIKEFVEYYRNLKFKKIIIYDNNKINGEKFDKILKNEIKNNFIEIVNYRGFKTPQKKSIIDCYHKNNKKYDWIAFYDIDEFLYINNYNDINKFLSLPKFQKCQSILINWKYYGDNNKVYYEPKPLRVRFVKPFYFVDKALIKRKKLYYYAAKTIVRGGLNLSWGLMPHYIKSTINCRPDGKIERNYFSRPQYSIAYLKHYITKSTEEFINRLNRGDVRFNATAKYIKYRIFNYYFIFNKITKEKLNLFKQRLKGKLNITYTH